MLDMVMGRYVFVCLTAISSDYTLENGVIIIDLTLGGNIIQMAFTMGNMKKANGRAVELCGIMIKNLCILANGKTTYITDLESC